VKPAALPLYPFFITPALSPGTPIESFLGKEWTFLPIPKRVNSGSLKYVVNKPYRRPSGCVSPPPCGVLRLPLIASRFFLLLFCFSLFQRPGASTFFFVWGQAVMFLGVLHFGTPFEKADEMAGPPRCCKRLIASFSEWHLCGPDSSSSPPVFALDLDTFPESLFFLVACLILPQRAAVMSIMVFFTQGDPFSPTRQSC